MKKNSILLVFAGFFGFYLGHTQDTTAPQIIRYIPEDSFNGLIADDSDFIVEQLVYDPLCCSIFPAISCCQQDETWNVDTSNIEKTVYSRYRVTADWCATNTCFLGADADSEDFDDGAYSESAGITIRSSNNAFGAIQFLTSSQGGKLNSRPTKLTFEGDFTVPYDANNDNLEIDFFLYESGYSSIWSNVMLELYKPTDCDRPPVITEGVVTSNSYSFSWATPAGNTALSYTWQILPLSKNAKGCPVDQGTTNTRSASSGKLLPETPYILQIQSVCASGLTSVIKEVIFETISDGTPPLNDNIENAIPIAITNTDNGDKCFYLGNTTDATIDQQDAPAGIQDGGAIFHAIDANNVWYSYTGNDNLEKITLELCDSEDVNTYDFDFFTSDLLVYKGIPGNLKLVSVPQDYCGREDEEQPNLSFISDGTTTYYISIDGNATGDGSNTGNYRLDVKAQALGSNKTPPTNDECEFAEELTNNGAITQGNLKNATPSYSVDIDTPCEALSWKDVWFKVALNGTSDLNIRLVDLPGQGDQAKFALYSSNFGVCGNWENKIPIETYSSLIWGEDEMCNDFMDTYTYRCLDEGIYFVRVFSDDNSTTSFGISATAFPAGAAVSSHGTSIADQSPVFLDDAGQATISVTEAIAPNLPTGFESLYILAKDNTVISKSEGTTSPGPTQSFTVDQIGTYTIHNVVYNPNSVDIDAYLYDKLGDTIEALTLEFPCGALIDVAGTTIEVTDQTLSNDRINDYGFNFQPNPVNTTLKLSAKQPINKVVLYTIQGQRVRSTNPNTMHSEIDMSALANGLYFIEVSINNTIQTARIIKQ